MIFDCLKNAERYTALHARFAAAFAFLDRATQEQLPTGRYELDGEALFAMVQEYDTNPPENNRFEAHRRYIDIQYVIEGNEAIEAAEIDRFTPDGDFSEERDVGFYRDVANPTRAILTAGEYGIFFPHDVHKPGLHAALAPEKVRKIVVKVRV